ncbi:MAG: glycosyltransferase [Chloroflexota bacterium]
MHITLLTYGSRGDVQPFLALAIGLQKAGHTVKLAAPGRFDGFVSGHGIPFVGLAGDPAEISLRFNAAGTNAARVIQSIRDYVYDIAPQVTRQARAALSGADLVVHSFLFTTGAHTFAREMGIPDVSVQTFPMFAPTREFPNVAMTQVPPGPLSYFSHWLATQVFWYGGNTGTPRFSRQFPQDFPKKLYWPFKKVDERPLTPLVIAVSPSVIPRPRDWTSAHIHLPGYFFLDEPNYAPPPELADFLAAGDPPVCVSFGSMVNEKGEQIGQSVLAALRTNGLRGVILTGWGGWEKDSTTDDVLYLESAPHSWLLPRCCAFVHHGGAGTTAAGLRAGIPNIVVPFAGDQPFWGQRVAALGAGPSPIPVKRLSAETLGTALGQIKQATSPKGEQAYRLRAAALGEKIRGEDGIGAAIRIIERGCVAPS